MELSVEKRLTELLLEGSEALSLRVGEAQAAGLVRYLDLLLTWNKKVNLTAITGPEEAVEGHLLDSLAAAPALAGVESVVDLGAGGGLPGIPLALLLPEVEFTLVDTVGKKVGFLKAAAASLGLKNLRAVHARAEGAPGKEGIPVCGAAIARAFMAPAEWTALARHYVKEGGLILAMLGAETGLPEQMPEGVCFLDSLEYRLPRSGARRRVARFRRGPLR